MEESHCEECSEIGTAFLELMFFCFVLIAFLSGQNRDIMIATENTRIRKS